MQPRNIVAALFNAASLSLLILPPVWAVGRQKAIRHGPQPACSARLSAGEQAACARINQYRAAMGLQAVVVSDSLCAAAQFHSRYLDSNGENGHTETAGFTNFTGATPADRRAAFGCPSAGAEDVGTGNDPADTVRRLFNAPYHRIPMMQPGPVELGIGVAGKAITVEFGEAVGPGVVAYPYSGQAGVPTSWTALEFPNPLRMHTSNGVVGYPITLAICGLEAPLLQVSSASLTDSTGAQVPVFINSPQNDDELKSAVIVIPQKPLRGGVLYTVTVNATVSGGLDVSRIWRFTTAADAPNNTPLRATVSEVVVRGRHSLLLQLANVGATPYSTFNVALNVGGRRTAPVEVRTLNPGDGCELTFIGCPATADILILPHTGSATPRKLSLARRTLVPAAKPTATASHWPPTNSLRVSAAVTQR